MMLFNDIRLDKSLHIENNTFTDLKILIDTTDSKIFEIEFLSFHMIKNKLPLREKCPNTELSLVRIFIQSECGKARTRKNSVFGHFSRRIDVHRYIPYLPHFSDFIKLNNFIQKQPSGVVLKNKATLLKSHFGMGVLL